MSETKVRRVVVTGARGALGSGVVEHYLAAGCEVVGLDVAGLDGTGGGEGVVPDGKRAGLSWIRCDLTQSQQARDAIAAADAALGGLDAVIHCAGGFRWTKLADAPDEDIDFLLGVNLRSSMYVLREALAIMKPRAFGRVVLVSSRSTLGPGVGEGPYAATKAGINALVSAAAAEVRELDITVNAVLPSIIDTPANRAEMPSGHFDTWVKIDALAGIIATLTGPVMDQVNGALIPVSART